MADLYREYDPAALARLQDLLRGMLRDFAALCERHGIPWWTDAGTTIGALRHGGMIPWDDDIDVCLLRTDFDRILSLAETELGDRYYVLDARRHPAYPLPTARLCLRGTTFREEAMRGVDAPFGVFLDLYAFDNLADDPREARRQWRRAWLWGKLRILHAVRSPVLYFSGPKAALVRAACFAGHYALRALFSGPFLRDRAEHWARLHEQDATERVFFPFAPVPFRNDIRRDEVFPTRAAPFDGQTVQVARGADAFLRREFGDYMVPPPPEKRHNHPPAELDFGPWTAEGGVLRQTAPLPPAARRAPSLAERQSALKDLAYRVVDALEGAGIRCFGLFGTALGAARHGDMVPWDDDVDLGVLRADLPRATEILRADPRLFVWEWTRDPSDPANLVKVFNRIDDGQSRADHDANLDLFVLDEEPAGRLWRRSVAALLLALRLAIVVKTDPPVLRRVARRRYAPLRLAVRVAAAPFSVRFLKRLHDRLPFSRRRKTGALWIPCDVTMKGMSRSFPAEWFERPARLPFGEREIPVPSDPDAFLRLVYGDWRTPPPSGGRRGHSYDAAGQPTVFLPADAQRLRANAERASEP